MKKYIVCFPILLAYSIFIFPVGIGLFIAIYNSDPSDPYRFTALAIMIGYIVLTFIILFLLIYLCGPVIKIDKDGVSRSLLGVFLRRKYSWQDIVCIKKYASGVEWVCFSDIELSSMKKPSWRTIRTHTIFLTNQKGLDELIRKYCSEKLID